MKNIFIIIIFLSISIMSLATENDSLSVIISSDRNEYNLNEDIIISFNVENNSAKKNRFCNYQTPFEGYLAPLFIVKNKKSGQIIEYRGPMVKRTKPGKENYIEIAPGNKESCTINLLTAYKIKEKGKYIIQFQGTLMNGLTDSNSIEIEIK